jgi:metallo-beta-lactamase family protein
MIQNRNGFLSFCGAAGEVTGSSHLMTFPTGEKVMIDYGLFQGKREEAFKKNTEFTHEYDHIDAVLLSHAHIDHSGRIPYMVKQGYKGKVHATNGTKDLCDYMLADSGQIQEQDAAFFKEKGIETKVPIEPLYTEADAIKAMLQFEGHEYHEQFQLSENIEVEFFEAGHVLGSSIIVIRYKTDDGQKTLVFTGDLGRKGRPIIRDMEQVPEADYLMIESTYGNRAHESEEDLDKGFKDTINETIANRGKIIIPAFALERTQEIVYRLEMLIKAGDIPEVPIYVDSPLAIDITEVFRRHTDLYDEEVKREFLDNHDNPFGLGKINYTRTVDESKALNHKHGPMIIISASGMCEVGRIRHHLASNIVDRNNTIMIVGYQAEHTLGRHIVNGEDQVKIFNKYFKVEAKVKVFSGFSAHGDMHDLDGFVKGCNGVKKVILVHGEDDSRKEFAERIKGFCDAEVFMPYSGDSVEL